MLPILMALFVANYRVYGARKLWIAARRAGHDIGRDQVARLMTILDIHGVTRRRKRVWTTRSDGAPRSPDLVERNFTAAAPNELWVTDLTYVPTWSGVAYVAFIVDVYSRMIVGWRVAAHMRTDMVLDALNMAAWNRQVDLAGLVTHSDAGSQFTVDRADLSDHRLRTGPVTRVGAVAAGRVVLGVAEMLIHLDLQAGLEDLLGEITQQPSRADQIDALRASPRDELLRNRLIQSTFIVVVGGRCHHRHIMVCHCLSFRPNHDDSAFQARPVTPLT